jgi:hypothetical protein
VGTFSYENQGTYTFLIYTADSNEETDSVAVGMTANNKLEGVISPGIQQKNMKMVYKYNITSLTSLEDVLLSVLNEKRLVMLLESMTKSIFHSQQYLLTEENFLLDPAHIYVNVSSGEASMIVSPVVRSNGIDFRNFIKDILNSVISDESENCSYIVKIRNYVNRRDGFSYEGLLDTLSKLGNTNNSVYTRADIPVHQTEAPVAPVVDSAAPVISRTEVKSSAAPAASAVDTPGQPHIQQTAPANGGSRLAGMNIPGGKKEPVQNDGSVVPGTKSEKPEKGKGFGLGKLFGKKEKTIPEKKENNSPLNFAFPGKAGGTSQPKNASDMQIPSAAPQNYRVEEAVSPKPASAQTPPAQTPPSYTPQSFVEENYGNTVLMADDDDAATVLLSGEDTLLQNTGRTRRRVYITRVKNQQKMEIAKPMFKIGRSADTADFYVAGNGMVGREHAFILLDGGNVFIKDNNSKNHTYVNDVMVNAGEKVELKDQDLIRIADEMFEITMQ